MKEILLLTVDAAGTLLKPWPSVGAVYGRTARKRNIKVNDQDLDSQFGLAFSEIQKGNQSFQGNEKEFWRKVVKLTFQPFTCQYNDESLFEELWNLFASGEPWRLADHAVTTLTTLKKKGYRLAVLSNNDSRLRNVLKDLKVNRLFECTFISSEIGFEKPEVQIFKKVEDSLRVPPEKIMHLGDSYSRDYMGAKHAGWHPILYGKHPETDNYIVSFEELLKLLP